MKNTKYYQINPHLKYQKFSFQSQLSLVKYKMSQEIQKEIRHIN